MRVAAEDLFKNIAYFFLDKRYRNFIWLSLKLSFAKRYKETTTSISGLKFKVPDYLSFIWQYHEIFHSESYKFQTTKVSPLIYDCGANVGTSVLYFKKNYPKAIIKAFEPDPKVFGYLKNNLEKNKIQDVQLFNAAVWTENTTLNFEDDGADAGKISQNKKASIQVKALWLKELLQKETEIDLLKIDIEGAEYAVLEDCQTELQKVNHLFVECHSFLNKPQKIEEILTILTNARFRYFIHNESRRKSPFINKTPKQAIIMDMQLNIFAYKESTNS